MHPDFPPLDLPPVDPSALKRGMVVQTRYFYADSVPGRQATVVRVRHTPKGAFVRCNYGKNLSGQSLLKWMCADALALVSPDNALDSSALQRSAPSKKTKSLGM